jgi:pyridoxine 5-phosphate synthase
MKKTYLSVNINKVALIRNSRGANLPDIIQFADDCIKFGADGITVHPRPDERHIKYKDVMALKESLTLELNVEGYPSAEFLALIEQSKPAQCTLVPDAPGALTSDAGWNIANNKTLLIEVIERIHSFGCRVSLFIEPKPSAVELALLVGSNRVELYTGPFAKQFKENPVLAIQPYVQAANAALELGVGLNAGHDLNLANLAYLKGQIPGLDEVSIGHALICDALYMGIGQAIASYQKCLNEA